jgi:hypothetical protein
LAQFGFVDLVERIIRRVMQVKIFCAILLQVNDAQFLRGNYRANGANAETI